MAYNNSRKVEIESMKYGSHGIAKPKESVNYWWLCAKPYIWNISEWAIGEEKYYTLYNKDGNKRRIFANFENAKVGDIVVCYEASPVKQVHGLAVVSRESDESRIYFKKLKVFTTPVGYADIKACRELEDMEFFINPNGSFFKLTKDEYNAVLDLVNGNDSDMVSKDRDDTRQKMLDKDYVNRLTKLYEAIETFREEGMATQEQEQKVGELEEEIIKKDILPVLTRTIEPALQPVQRELVLVVDYVPGQPLSVHLSRKRNFTANMSDVKKIDVDPEINHHEYRSHTDEKICHGPARDITVYFPDGTIISEKKAVDTLFKVVQKIGVTKVRKVVVEHNLRFCRVLVISNIRDAKYGHSQKEMGDGWLLMTHSNNLMKKSFIEKVSNVLNLGIRVVMKD